MTGSNDDTFFRVTNQNIWNEIQELKKLHEQHMLQDSENYRRIMQKQDITNGKVKLTRWMATTALSLVTIIIIYLVNKG